MNLSLKKTLNNGYIFAFLALLSLSFRSALVKLAYQQNILTMDLFFLRFFFAIPMLFLLAYYNNREDFFIKISDFKVLRMTFLAGIFGYYLATLMDFYALALIPANVSRIILYIFPIFVVIINALITKKSPDLRVVTVFFLALLAVFLVMGGVDLNIVTLNATGAYFSLLAALSYAIYIIINNSVANKIGSSLFTFLAVFFSFILINIHYFLFNDEKAVMDIAFNGWLIIITMSFFCTFLPLVLISEAISRIGLIKFSLFSNLGPFLAVTISFLSLGEVLTWQQFVGVSIVVIALFSLSKNNQ